MQLELQVLVPPAQARRVQLVLQASGLLGLAQQVRLAFKEVLVLGRPELQEL